MWEDAKTETAPKTKKSQLFVIKQRGRDMFWNCSAEHGSGWNQGWPKQAWSKSELANEIRLMIERNFFQDCEILELKYNVA